MKDNSSGIKHNPILLNPRKTQNINTDVASMLVHCVQRSPKTDPTIHKPFHRGDRLLDVRIASKNVVPALKEFNK